MQLHAGQKAVVAEAGHEAVVTELAQVEAAV